MVPDNQLGLETQNIDETMVDQTQAMEAVATQKLGEEKPEKVNPSGSRDANQEAPADCRDLLIARLQAQMQAMEQGLNAPVQPPPKAPAAEAKAPLAAEPKAPLAAEPKAPMEQELQPPPKAPAAAPKAPMEQELNVPVPPKAPAVPPKALSVQAPPAKAVPPASAESTLLYEAPPATEAPATQDLASAGIDLGAIAAAAKAPPAIMGSLPAGAGTEVTTTSHRAEAMQLRRAMEAPDAEKTFPHMHKLFQGSKSVACL